MNTRDDWYVACTLGDLAAGEPVATCVLGEHLVVWRSGDEIVVMEDRCVHRAAALSQGRCEGANLRCMYHGLLFDHSGTVVAIPGQDIIPPNARVRTYPVAARYGWVWVWMGNPAKVDQGRLPQLFEGVNLDDFGMASGVLDFDASAQLISDNLLDFSHLPYVHASSFQPASEWAESTMTMKALDRGVRFERWLPNQPGNGFFISALHGGPCDEWLGYDYLVPGVLIMWTGAFPLGTARSVNFERPDFSTANGRVTANVQAITPVNESQSRYYFTTGLHLTLSSGHDQSLVDHNCAVTLQAFREDKRVIEAQQKIVARDPDRAFMPTAHDKGVTMYNRLKTRLIEAEAMEESSQKQTASAL